MSPATPLIGSGNLPKVQLRAADGARAEVYLHGAHVSSWVPAGGQERLFLSEKAEFRPGAAIRGGIPVIFPQFASEGPLPKHGFARSMSWELVDQQEAEVRLRLKTSEATQAIWPALFQAEVVVGVCSSSLSVALEVLNTGDDTLSFTAALHTYLRVEDIASTGVEGLQGVRYRDHVDGNRDKVEPGPRIRFQEEVDRTYFDAPSRLLVREPHRLLQVCSEGFPDAVVWNPGPELGAKLGDMEPGGHQRMVCVEAAAIGRPVRLAAGARWRGVQILDAR